MLKKFFAATLLLTGIATATFAGDCVTMDLNYWCRGTLKLLTENLPDGVTVSARRDYSQPQFAHICYYRIIVDLDKTQTVNLSFEVTGVGDQDDTAKLVPSASPFRNPKDGKTSVVECLEFECFDEPAPSVPCKISKWTGMIPDGVFLRVGDKFTIKAKYKSLTE